MALLWRPAGFHCQSKSHRNPPCSWSSTRGNHTSRMFPRRRRSASRFRSASWPYTDHATSNTIPSTRHGRMFRSYNWGTPLVIFHQTPAEGQTMDISTLKTKLQQIGQTRVAAALDKLDPTRQQALAGQLKTFNPDAI